MKKTLNTSALVTADSPKGQRATETFRAQYNKAGLDEDGAQRLNEHAGFAAYLLAVINRFSAKAPDYALAQSILGADFITPEEVMKARPSIVYTDEQILALAKLAAQIEARFQYPQQTEWALANNQLYIIQTQPIATVTAYCIVNTQ